MPGPHPVAEAPSPSGSRPLTVAAILLSMFMSAMEATVVSTAMPTVVSELRGLELYGWVGAIYMLAMTVTMPVWGKLADVLGRKPIMLGGLLVFLAGSMGSGLAPTMHALIALRAVQGVGAGALQPVALTIIGDLFTVEERGRIQGIFGAVWGFAGMVGPLAGGLIVASLSWRWVFFINLPFGLLSGVLLTAFYREARDASASSRGRKIDVAGALLLSTAVLTLLLGVGGRAPWLTLPVAVGSLAAFVAVERRAADPLLPLTLLSRPVIRIASVAGGLMGSVMMGVVMYTPLWVQAVLHGSPTEAGTAVAPMLIGWPIASAVSGRLLRKVGYRPLVRGGMAVVGVGTVAVYLALGHGALLLRPATFLLGTGMGLANTALLIAVQENAARSERGVATASTMFFRTIGGAVVVGALGALVAGLLRGKVPEHMLDDLLGPEHGKALSPAALGEYEGLIAAAMRPVFVVIAVLGGAALVAGSRFPDVAPKSTPELEGTPAPLD
jgi:EmrB/QacA subfamily drug resistance transporter